MILENYSTFMRNVFSQLHKLGIDTDTLFVDHIGYQANSAKDYEDKLETLKTFGEIIGEHIVGGRRVCVINLNDSLNFEDNTFNIIEVFEPREGQIVQSFWEHIEFLVPDTLEEFIKLYPNIKWNTDALNREEFPMLILQLEDGLRVKFPRRGVLEEDLRVNNKKTA